MSDLSEVYGSWDNRPAARSSGSKRSDVTAPATIIERTGSTLIIKSDASITVSSAAVETISMEDFVAPILHEVLSEKDIKNIFRHSISKPFVIEQSSTQAARVLRSSSTNSFLEAVHYAFAKHKRLVLTPDAVFLPLLQAAAQYVLKHSEDLRHVFVSHSGKEKIEVRRDNFVLGYNNNDWLGTLPDFEAALREKVKGDAANLAMDSFSTTTPEVHFTYVATMMCAMSNYFQYEVSTLCGIPEISIEGSLEDWQQLRTRFLRIAETFMQKTTDGCSWVRGVLCFLDEFISVKSGGAPNSNFWRDFYKFEGSRGSGSDHITGNVCILFPWSCRGVWHGTTDYMTIFPSAWTQTEFIWNYFGKKIPMSIMSGFSGVEVSKDNCEVKPIIGTTFIRFTE